MTNKEYVKKIEDTFKQCVKIVRAKNSDYSGEDDAFKAFQAAWIVGVRPRHAILVRMIDKISRVNNLLTRPKAKVTSESISDTLMDLANYAIILKVMIEDES